MKKTTILIIAIIICMNVSAQNVGVGTTAPTEKLEVAGNLKVSGTIMPGGDAGTAGQVLTSTGNGTPPAWKNAPYTGGRFWIIPANNARSAGSFSGRGGWNVDGAANETSQDDSLDYGSSNVSGSEFTISNPGLTNNFITVNTTGLYHFEGALRYFTTSVTSVKMLPRSLLTFLANQPTSSNLSLLLLEDVMEKTGGTETSSSSTAPNNYNYTAKFSLNIHLQAGTTCTFKTGFNLLRYPNATDLISLGVSQGGYISGHFISE